MSADMSDEDSISAAVQAVTEQIGAGGLNLLINNAAINTPETPAPLSATEKEDMMKVYETNVVGPFLIAKVGSSHSPLCFYSPVYCQVFHMQGICVGVGLLVHRQENINIE